jgi:hypothetical protein
MLILRGIAGKFAGKHYPRGALDEKSAVDYAEFRGYAGNVLDVSGETGANSKQTNLALSTFMVDKTIGALYGFSGGGYNVYWMLTRMTAAEKRRLKLLVVIGAPKRPASAYRASAWHGHWELVYRTDPKTGHMDGPRALLEAHGRAESAAGGVDHNGLKPGWARLWIT